MKIIKLVTALIAGSAVVSFNASGQFATSVVNYSAGVDYADGYTDPSVSLGAPSSVTPGEFGGPVTPFSGPYLASQNVSLGVGGSLTLQFSSPIQNNTGNPYGIDFLIFGATSFLDVDWPNGVADATGSTFGSNAGETRVYVGNSTDNLYLLNPSMAPVVDGMFPTDGSGNVHIPVDPSLNNPSFANKTLAEIRALYRGSAGGTGFDLAWAVDDLNNPVALNSIQFIRVDILSGRSEIDAFSVVMVPEPSTILLAALGGTLLTFARRKRQG